MKLTRFLIPIMALSLSTSALPVYALTPLLGSGDLIKGSTSASVYYRGADGKRYVFPNEKTFKTWYANFAEVNVLNDAELANYPIGGSVTYRPGLKLVKVTTDPRTYAVAATGTLRWITSEAVARDLYGTDWNTKVDDVSDAFFVNYRVGTPITQASDYSVSAELAFAVSIGRDKGLDRIPIIVPPVTPTPTSTAPMKSGTLVPGSTTIAVNDIVSFMASANPSYGIWYVKIFFDGFLQRTCEYSPCGADIRIPADKTSYDAVAQFSWTDGGRFSVTTTIPVVSNAPGITITTRPEVKTGTSREVIVDVDSSFVATTTDIYLDGNNVRGCNGVQRCRYTAEETSPVGTVHSVYAIIRDANGFTRQSGSTNFTVVANEHPVVTVLLGKTSLHPGETLDVTVSATDDDGIASTDITTDDGSFSKHCNTSSCNAIVTRPAAGTFRFLGSATDLTGLVSTASSSVITVE